MRGTTLIELLVALVLAGLVMAGALTGLAQAQRVRHDVERQARLHERAQYVFGTLEPELQMAGYYGTDTAAQLSGSLAALTAMASCGFNSALPMQPAVRVLRGNWSLPCPAQGRGALDNSDVLILSRASARVTSTVEGALQVLSRDTPPAMRALLLRIYYVARAADGDPLTPALRVKSLTAVAGNPAFIDTEVMPGVDDLQIELLPNAVAPRMVRVRLRVRADAADRRGGATPPVLVLDRRFNVRNATTS
jgi:Tfp pilus assembly protein PilW